MWRVLVVVSNESFEDGMAIVETTKTPATPKI